MNVIERVKSTLGAYAAEDVRAMLHDDHETLRELAKELAEAASAPSRRSLLGRLQPLLTAHSRAEEQAVYVPMTMLRNSPDSRMAGSEGAVEHSLADTVLGRLCATDDASTDMWKAHAKVLHELLEHHIEEEERELFEELGEHFSEEERTQMGVEFLARKNAQLKKLGASGGRTSPTPR